MTKRRMQFPMVVRTGSVAVKIYKVSNKGRDSFTISYCADGQRKLKMFSDFEEAHQETTSKAISLSKGELDVLHLSNAERVAYVHAVEAVIPPLRPSFVFPMRWAKIWVRL